MAITTEMIRQQQTLVLHIEKVPLSSFTRPLYLFYFYSPSYPVVTCALCKVSISIFLALFLEKSSAAPKVHMLGLLTTDISSLSNLIIPNVDVRFKLTRNKSKVKTIFNHGF